MLLEGVSEGFRQHCPVVGAFEETGWSMQSPVSSQWQREPLGNVCGAGASVYGNFNPGQCYRTDAYAGYAPVGVQQYYPQNVYIPPAQFRQPPSIPNLPCHQSQQWDYSSMCYNVDGQACQYTNIGDLEDFMNNEKRKEKSRVAARCRRTKEMQIFAELTAALPARKEEVEQLDKASVMRLAISYLRVRDVVSLLPASEEEQPKIQEPKGLEEISSELSYMKALDGFVLVLSQQGDIVYCSENIADHLGVSQMEIMGQSVFEFSHPCDHEEIREALRTSKSGRRDLLLRLKCTLTSKGRNVHLKSASYKVIHITGHMLTAKDKESDKLKPGSMVAVGRPIAHPSNIEIPLDCRTFLSKHSLDMKFTYVDEALTNTLGFESEELVGHSLYDYHHAADSAAMAHLFKSLFSKGQCETGQYRFLAKAGGYAWVQTQATVITDKQQKPISIVCVNYVISGIECKDEVFAAHQVQHVDLKPVVVPIAPVPVPSAPLPPVEPPGNGAIVAIIPPEEERPIPVTELIFAPLNQNMNKGFFMPLQDEGHTMLKDEPEILDHLAPSAGDACIPLENSPFDEMFNDFLSDNYCSLTFLGDDLANGSPVDSMSPDSLLLSSPEPRENDSSCEQSSLLTDLSLDAFDSTRSDNDLDDGNSSFIPIRDELPVLEPAVMWGALPDSVSMARPQPTEPVTVTSSPAPALQRLLMASTNGPPPQDLISNLYSDQGLTPSRKLSTWDTGCKRVLKQEQEPCAKRAKRSPSPAQQKPSNQSSSVLMNLLDQQPALLQNLRPTYMVSPQLIQQNVKSALPIINIIQAVPNVIQPAQKDIRTAAINQALRSNIAMSPLTLNVGSPIYSLPSSPAVSPAQKDVMTPYSPKYSLPSSPSYSPAVSPAVRERVMSPYTPQSMSPVGKYLYSPNRLSPAIQGNDPYLTTKMQASPITLQHEIPLLDTNVQMNSSDFWSDTEMLRTGDLLTAFDDVKLV